MRTARMLVIALTIIITVGCSDPTIDASSDQTMQSSKEAVRESLPEGKRDDFDDALQVVAMHHINVTGLIFGGPSAIRNEATKARKWLHGKTGDQLIAEAQQIIGNEIRDLENKRLESERASEQLKKLRILQSQFYIRDEKYLPSHPVIDLTVKNDTGKAISWAYFEGTLASPDRNVPWVKNTFSHNIPGGLEPGENATWEIALAPFSGWGGVDVPADAVLSVTVERLDGADGKPIYSMVSFDERDQARLQQLKKQVSGQ